MWRADLSYTQIFDCAGGRHPHPSIGQWSTVMTGKKIVKMSKVNIQYLAVLKYDVSLLKKSN